MSGIITIPVATASRDYDVLVGAGLLDSLGELMRDAGITCDAAFVVSDENVAPLYLDQALSSLERAEYRTGSVVVDAGEPHKNLNTYGRMLQAMAASELTRDSVVVALGGGVVGDMAGFAAATYMRGIHVVQVPTTLLAMVDSSVGGKTAIDIAAGKNLVGAFLQPSLVVADVTTLSTLPGEVFVDGLGEVVKHGVLADPSLFDELSARPVTQAESTDYLVHTVARNVEIKRDVVGADERERGLRQTLNLGHTLGHAIEAASGYRLDHGHCVAAGLCCIARATERLGWAKPQTSGRIERCVTAQGLPVDTTLDHEELFSQATHDKKRHADTLNIVVPTTIGSVEMRTITLAELRQIIDLGCGVAAREA